MCVLMCNFVSYFVCVILCIFVFLCDILLPSGVINDDRTVSHHWKTVNVESDLTVKLDPDNILSDSVNFANAKRRF